MGFLWGGYGVLIGSCRGGSMGGYGVPMGGIWGSYRFLYGGGGVYGLLRGNMGFLWGPVGGGGVYGVLWEGEGGLWGDMGFLWGSMGSL